MNKNRVKSIVIGIVTVAVTAAFFMYRSEVAQIERVRTQARGGAEVTVSSLFKQFKRSEEQKGEIVQWSGTDSKVLWVQYNPEHEDSGRSGSRDVPESWTVWAETKNGRLFALQYLMKDDGTFYTDSTISEPERASLVRELIKAGEIARAKSLGITVKGA